MFFLTFLMYFLSASAVFSYGIGMNFLSSAGGCIDFRLFKTMPRLVFTAVLSCALLWFPVSMFIAPFGLGFVIPVAVFFVSAVIYTLLPSVFIFESRESPQIFEYLFLFGIVFLSLSEGISFIDSLVISLSCMLSFFLFLFLVISVLQRISVISVPGSRSGFPMYLVLLGIFSMFAFVFSMMWGSHSEFLN